MSLFATTRAKSSLMAVWGGVARTILADEHPQMVIIEVDEETDTTQSR